MASGSGLELVGRMISRTHGGADCGAGAIAALRWTPRGLYRLTGRPVTASRSPSSKPSRRSRRSRTSAGPCSTAAMPRNPPRSGEPLRMKRRRESNEVYPRVCGGTMMVYTFTGFTQGLSPRVRGNHGGTSRRGRTRGSIPACAGEPPPRKAGGHQLKVYPRVCGGTTRPSGLQNCRKGLSPRVRGNPVHGVVDGGDPGSIPACAGEPDRSGSPPGGCRVYPRVCGGTRTLLSSARPVHGLSPRVRGNPCWKQGRDGLQGSIPACAGEPRHRR